ncbi:MULTISPECIES: Lin1244/Lin1753 domain-containing protein [unclassified Enterococcus]|jgi:hypothetical protein|uniref:Lin1244/Lin1753 domain-containing protein n=1 Tax=unclassified Enterococcus TaxID=2608891 RepID=UPI003D2B93C1
MARPMKEGLDYFPLDVHIFEDEKIEAIAGEFGIKGELAVIKLLCAIYEKGYFIQWDELTKAKLLKRIPGANKKLLEEVVERLVTWGFFHQGFFDSAKVLTSLTIQATYFEATKRRKGSRAVDYVIQDTYSISEKEINVNINPQSKRKESEVKKRKDNPIEQELTSIFNYLEKNGFGNPKGNRVEKKIFFWMDALAHEGFTAQQAANWLIHGVNTAIENNSRRWSYIEGILNNRFDKKIFTEKQINEEKSKHKQSRSIKNTQKTRHEKLPDWLEHPQNELELSSEEKAEVSARFKLYQQKMKVGKTNEK